MAKISFHWSLVVRVVTTVLLAAVLLLISLKVEPAVAEENPWLTKTPMSVLIYNDMPGGVVVVNCVCRHCYKIDTVLDQQQYLYQLHKYEFHFKMSFWGNTYVWCKFVYGQLWNGFKVWTGPGMWGQRRMPCQQCVLAVRADGIYQGKVGAKESMVWVRPWLPGPPPKMD